VSEASMGASLTAYIITYSGMLIAYMVVITHMAGKGITVAAVQEKMQ